jgi:Co/Zn/Cd efflux system component
MSSCCDRDSACEPSAPSPAYQRVLWIALWVNSIMFVVELLAGHRAGSASLLADAVDFMGDAANYAVSIFVLALGALWSARAALLKGITMGLYGLFLVGRVVWGWIDGAVPTAETMGIVGAIALFANVTAALLLFRFREGDANMRSVGCARAMMPSETSQ